jgi:hypothetical protein
MDRTDRKAVLSQQRSVHTYSELWHASSCVLRAGTDEPRGSSWQFLSSVVLTAFAFEAYLNHVGSQALASWQSLDRLSYESKLNLLCETLKVSLPGTPGQRPRQTIGELFRFRNAIAHGRSQEISQERTIALDELEAHRARRPLLHWERLIQNSDFALRVREDVEAVLNAIQTARPEPKEILFSFGSGTWTAIAQ